MEKEEEEEEEEGRFVKFESEVETDMTSAGCVTAQKGIKHGELHPLLVSTTPGNHGTFAVGCVQVVSVARVCEADNRFA